MVEEGLSHDELCLWENQSLVMLNSLAGNMISGNIPTEGINKTLVSSTVNTPTAGKDTKDQPPPSQPSAPTTWRKKRGRTEVDKSNKAKKGGGGDEEDDSHILTERERRKRMRDMFDNLHALLPRLTNKADKSSIVDEAVSYIRSLQSKLDVLEKKKQDREQPYKTREAFLADQGSSNNDVIPFSNTGFNSSGRFPVGFQIWTSSNVVLTISGEEAQFSICSTKKFGTLSAILSVMEKYKIEVLAANISSDAHRNIYMIQAHHVRGDDQLMELFSVEDIYQQASEEIRQWISS